MVAFRDELSFDRPTKSSAKSMLESKHSVKLKAVGPQPWGTEKLSSQIAQLDDPAPEVAI